MTIPDGEPIGNNKLPEVAFTKSDIEISNPTENDNLIIINPADFPFPARPNTSASGEMPLPGSEEESRIKSLQDFSIEQARMANIALNKLYEITKTRHVTTDDYRDIYMELVQWRYEWAKTQTTHPFFKGAVPFPPDRYLEEIPDQEKTLDRIGHHGIMEANPIVIPHPETDPTTGILDPDAVYLSGTPTPASIKLEEAGVWAKARFEEEGNTGDTLKNIIILPSGEEIEGSSIIRGNTAKKAAFELKHRVLDAHEKRVQEGTVSANLELKPFDTGDDEIIFIELGTKTNRDKLFTAAMQILGDLHPDRETNSRDWARAVYYILQGRQHRRGAGAVIEVFSTAVGAFLLGRTPTLLPDMYLPGNIFTESKFINDLTEVNTPK